MLSASQKYPSDLTDQQWDLIKDLIPRARTGGRPRTTRVRDVINGIFYLNRTGCPWRYLPKEFPPWQTLYDYFSQWVKSGIWKAISHALSYKARELAGKTLTPRMAIIDAQSVKAHFGEKRGFDGHKRVQGRKRNIIVDTLGLIWACEVHAAVDQDRHGGVSALKKIPKENLKTLEVMLADGGYKKGPFDVVVLYNYGLQLDAKTAKDCGGSSLKPKRWIVERTFAWFNHYRRLSRDYERKTSGSESMIYLAMTQLLLRRLAPP